MTTPVSAVDAAIDALLAAIAATPAFARPVVVSEGPPQSSPGNSTFVTIAERVEQAFRPHNMVGGFANSRSLQEQFHIVSCIWVWRGGDNATKTRQACTALANAFDTAVRADPTLGGTVLIAYPAAHTYQSEWDASQKARLVRCDITVACTGLP